MVMLCLCRSTMPVQLRSHGRTDGSSRLRQLELAPGMNCYVCKCRIYVASRLQELLFDCNLIVEMVACGAVCREALGFGCIASGVIPSRRRKWAAHARRRRLIQAQPDRHGRTAAQSKSATLRHAEARCMAQPCVRWSGAGPQKLRLRARGHADWRCDATVM